MSRRALDLFCGAGGASVGLARAGFDVHGVDDKFQSRYPFWFRRADWADVDLSGWDFIWASPPCVAFSPATRPQDRDGAPDLIAPVREALERSGAKYAIENVPRAPIRADLILQGDMFGLRVVRRRHFETNFAAAAPGPLTSGRNMVKDGLAAPGPLTSGRNMVKDGLAVTVAGGGSAGDIERWSDAMGIDWPMARREVVNAVPPAYAVCIGRWARFAIGDGPDPGQADLFDRPAAAWPSELLVNDPRGCAWPSGHPEIARPSLGQPDDGRSLEVLGLLGQADSRAD